MPSELPLIQLRLPKEIIIKIDKISAKEVRSRTGQIEFILRKFIDDYEKQNGSIEN
jgi:metal-responsive CopG/Arc/MetJ family transcriptional regulator